LLVAHFGPAEAQSTASTPEQVARDFFKAEQEGRWIDAARFLDLGRFEPIRRSTVEALRSMASRPKLTAEQLMKLDPAMPRAAAEYQARTMDEGFRDHDFLSRAFARVPSADSLAALRVDEAAARWLEAQGWRWKYELALKETKRRPHPNCPGLPDSVLRAMGARFLPLQSPILGATEASDSVRYVVVGFPEAAFSGATKGHEVAYPSLSPRALVLKRVDSNWRIVATPDMPHSDGADGMSTFAIGCGIEPSKPEVPKK
jgi:hypothetical protein